MTHRCLAACCFLVASACSVVEPVPGRGTVAVDADASCPSAADAEALLEASRSFRPVDPAEDDRCDELLSVDGEATRETETDCVYPVTLDVDCSWFW